MFYGADKPYQRAAIFPWGSSAQKGPDGEKVVSARAIKHVRELTSVATARKHRHTAGADLSSALLFVVARSDAVAFRANYDADPSFSRYLNAAVKSGVKVRSVEVCSQMANRGAGVRTEGGMEG